MFVALKLIVLTASDTKLFDKICKKILQLDSKIRFVGFISEMGRLVVGNYRSGTKRILDDAELEMMFMEVALRVRMRHQFDTKLGTVDYTVSKRRQMTVMSIPYRDCILYMLAEKDINVDHISKKILELLRRPELIES